MINMLDARIKAESYNGTMTQDNLGTARLASEKAAVQAAAPASARTQFSGIETATASISIIKSGPARRVTPTVVLATYEYTDGTLGN